MALSDPALAQAQSYFRKNDLPLEKKQECLAKLENKSTRECEKELLGLSPEKELPKEKLKQVTPTHSQLTVNVSNSVLEKLSKIKSLLSHKYPTLTQSELLEEMAEICLNRLDPERKKGKKDQCNMSKDKVSDSKLADSKLTESKLTESKLACTKLADPQLTDFELTDPQFASSTITDSKITDSTISGSANLESRRGASTAQIVQNKREYREYIPVEIQTCYLAAKQRAMFF